MTLSTQLTPNEARDQLYLLYLSKARAQLPVVPATAEIKNQLLDQAPPLVVERVEMSSDPTAVLRYYEAQ